VALRLSRSKAVAAAVGDVLVMVFYVFLLLVSLFDVRVLCSRGLRGLYVLQVDIKDRKDL
jgi:hypothetical protein